MPHSSGGGFHGGGFHGGSHGSFSYSGSSSSSSSYRKSFSRVHFRGSNSFHYYKNNKINYIYSDKKLSEKGAWGAISIFSKIVVLLQILIMAITTVFICQPKAKLPSFIIKDNRTIIEDNIDIFTQSEEKELKKVLDDFYDQTGIPVAVCTVSNSSWEGQLENYAYDHYLDTFSDEGHWMIIYSEYTGLYPEWAHKQLWYFEGMQGNYTDYILTLNRTYHFNGVLYSNLENEKMTVAESFIDAFEDFTPYVKVPEVKNMSEDLMGIVCLFYIFPLIFISIVVMSNFEEIKMLLKGVKFYETGVHKVKITCRECGNEYLENKDLKCCPYCNNKNKFSFFKRDSDEIE